MPTAKIRNLQNQVDRVRTGGYHRFIMNFVHLIAASRQVDLTGTPGAFWYGSVCKESNQTEAFPG